MPARKPHVTCHMLSSVDGRILSSHWKMPNAAALFESTAARIKVDAWIVGRTTMQEFSAARGVRIRRGGARRRRGDFVADYRAKTFAVAIDPLGKCRWKSGMLDTEHVIEVLTERVSAGYLEHLRRANVSYVFGGKRTLDLNEVLIKLATLFPIRRVRIDGGGHVNGSFLAAGLIDEFSHVIAPAADGAPGTPTVFDVPAPPRGRTANRLRLLSVRRLPRSVLWCRYRVIRPKVARRAAAR